MTRTVIPAGGLLLFVVACAGPPSLPPSPPPVPQTPASSTLQAAAPQPLQSEDAAAVPISPRNPTWGNRTALVTIVEFADFECPFSARVQATLASLRTKYGPDDLRVVWKNNPLPFHPNARAAAIAAMGVFDLAGKDAFWKFHDALFGHQGHFAEETYEQWAADAGVSDLATLRTGLAAGDAGPLPGQSGRWADAVDADLREAKSAGVSGTPMFFINGVFVNGAQPAEKFVAILDEELTKAKAKLAAGIPPGLLYAEMTRENRARANQHKDDAHDHPDPMGDSTTVFRIPVGASPSRGKATAYVTLVEFADFQCPFSSRVQPTLGALRTRYGDKLRIVWKNEPLPFHPAARPAAEAALEVRAEAGDAAFWAMHDALFAGQASLMNGGAPDVDAIVKMASATGADLAKVRAAIEHHTHAREIEADENVADDFQANGTPHFFINGRRLVGAQPEERFTTIIDEEIDKAQALAAKGIRPAELYATLTTLGKPAPSPESKDLPLLPGNDPARGNLRAKVILHEWADFQCPFSRSVEATLVELMKDYGSKIKLVWHDLPLSMHPDAALAARAAREAYQQKGPEGFWTMHDTLFSHQEHLKRDDLDGYARSMNLNLAAWSAALDGEAHRPELDADKDSGAAASIVGTPAFLVEVGSAKRAYFVNGAQSYRKFKKVIERALGEAK